MIRVLLADDQALVRAGFRALLEAQQDIQVIGEAGDGGQAVRLAREFTPDVALMDIRMPSTDGLAATRQIAANGQLASVRVVILTTFELDEYVFEAIRSGASGFLVKDTEPDELVQAVRVVAGGDALLSPSVTRRLIAEFAAQVPQPRAPAGLHELTNREQEVLALVGSGLSNHEIATRLYVSPATAKTHVSRAMSSCGPGAAPSSSSSLTNPAWSGRAGAANAMLVGRQESALGTLRPGRRPRPQAGRTSTSSPGSASSSGESSTVHGRPGPADKRICF